MLPSFSAFEALVEESCNRGGSWLFEYEEIDRMGELQREFKVASPEKAIEELKGFIDNYFKERGVEPVIEITLTPPSARITSNGGANFILAAKNLRGSKKAAKRFEDLVARQLAAKLTGQIMSVGYPRNNKAISAFREELKQLGVDATGLKKMKDGGLDIIWIPPLGKKSEIPFVNFQCKNTETVGNDVKSSVSDARKTLNRHEIFNGEDFLIFVVANTYLSGDTIEDSGGRRYICIGLPELLACSVVNPPTVFL